MNFIYYNKLVFHGTYSYKINFLKTHLLVSNNIIALAYFLKVLSYMQVCPIVAS